MTPSFLKLFVIALPIFFAVDMLWLGLIAKNFYSRQIGSLMRPDINWPPAILFYLLFVAGLIHFVVVPALNNRSWMDALSFGALFGLISYATYELSNFATLKGWPLKMVFFDIAWGSILAASVSATTFAIVGRH